MLTIDKLKIYEQFGGDIDAWSRTSRDSASTEMMDEDWYLIDELLSALFAVRTGVASRSFSQQLDQQLLANTHDEATRDRLRTLAAR